MWSAIRDKSIRECLRDDWKWAVTRVLYLKCIWYFHASLFYLRFPNLISRKMCDVRNAWEVGTWGGWNEMKQFGKSALANTVQFLRKIFSVLWNIGHQGDLQNFKVQCQGYGLPLWMQRVKFSTWTGVYQLILFVAFFRYSRQYFKTHHNTLLGALYNRNQKPKTTNAYLLSLTIPTDPHWMLTSGYSIVSNGCWRLWGNCVLHPAPSIETHINLSFAGNAFYLGVSYLHK
jgi:hypothetical protein